MLPKFQTLFPRSRILPGRNTRIQGRDSGRVVKGMTIKGTDNFIALRTQNTSTIPTIEPGAIFKAGSNVKVYGRDAILVLERVSEPVEETSPVLNASLEMEYEVFWAELLQCSLGTGPIGDDSYDNPDGYWIIEQRFIFNFQNGTITVTYTSNAATIIYGPGDPVPIYGVECNTTSESDEDPNFDYGYFIDQTLEEETITYVSTKSALIAAMEKDNAQSGSLNLSFSHSLWQTISETPNYINSALPPALSIGVNAIRAGKARVRFKNTGQVPLQITCGFYGTGLPGGASNIEEILNLSPNATSAWQEPPAPEYAPKGRYFLVPSVKIAQYIYFS